MNEATIIEVPAGTDYRRDAEQNFWTSLTWQTLFCLLETNGHLSISDLAAKVSMSVNETVVALESMEILGFVKRTDAGYVQVDESFVRVGRTKTDHVRIVEQYVHSSNQVANRILETAETGRHLTKSLTYNSNRQLILELYANIQKAVDEFKTKSDLAKPTWDGVYNLSASLIEMTEEV